MSFLRFRATTHPTRPSRLGSSTDLTAMESVMAEPGPIQLTTRSVNWSAKLSGLLNLRHPAAQAAGLHDRDEPILISAHVLAHPEHGTHLVDTGVSRRFVEDPAAAGVGWALRQLAGIQQMETSPSTADVIADLDAPLAGVFLTHLHLDHVSGFPDIPRDVPIYTGRGEARAGLFLNIVAQRTYDRLLAGRPPLDELPFAESDPAQPGGIVDVFGDRSLFAISTPGHTSGHVSFVARTTNGPVLLTGDVCHTRWGWQNDVEPGTFLAERERSRASLLFLRALSARHPHMEVRLGHQDL